MDGSLVDTRTVIHLLTPGDFHRFVKATAHCPPNQKVVQLLKLLAASGFAILIVTARSRQYEALTRDWLSWYGIEFDALYMRADGDRRTDKVVKTEMLEQLLLDGFRPVVGVDDNPTIIELWTEQEIHFHVVPGWFPGETPDDFDASELPYLDPAYTP